MYYITDQAGKQSVIRKKETPLFPIQVPMQNGGGFVNDAGYFKETLPDSQIYGIL